MLAVEFDALMHPTIAFVKVVLLCHLVVATVSHIVIVANPLLLLVPTTVPTKPSRQVGATCSVAVLLLWTWLGLRWLFHWHVIIFRRFFALYQHRLTARLAGARDGMPLMALCGAAPMPDRQVNHYCGQLANLT